MTAKDRPGRLDEALARIAELEAELADARAGHCRDMFDMLFEDAPGGLSIVTPEGEILACNREGAALLGYEPQELIGRRTSEFNVSQKPRKHLDRTMEQGRVKLRQIALRRKDGSVLWASFSARIIDYGGNKAILNAFSDITPYQEALKKLELDETRFERLYTLSEMIREPESDILDFALESITEMTGSPIGYIYRVSPDQTEMTLYAWSKGVMDQCRVQAFPETYQISRTGLWGDAIRQRRPIITNDYEHSAARRGCPQGHVPIIRHLNAPLFEDERIVLLAGVGNKEEDYTDEDVRQIELIMNSTWRIIQRKRSRAELTAAHEQLEDTVRRRTIRLELANNALIRFERIIQTNPDVIALVDRDRRYILVNETFLTLFGTTRDEVIGQPIEKTLDGREFERKARETVDKALRGETVRVESWLDLPKIGRRFMAVTCHPVSLDGSAIDFASVDARDMTELKRSEEALQIVANRLDLATDAGNIGIWEHDLRTDDLVWDKKMFELYKISAEEFTVSPEDWRSRLHPDDLSMVESETARSIETKVPLKIEFRIVWPDGEVRIIRSDAVVQIDEDNRPSRMIGVNMDITEQRQMEDELRRLASTDPLTGASNRRFFMERLAAEFERCKRYKTSLVLLSLDIDHFKRINDRYGHPAGDEVLKALVDLNKKTLRTTDIFGRVGGEEFQAVLTQTRITAGLKTAERLRALIEQSRVEVDGEVIDYTISIGVTELRRDDQSIEELLRRADNALYTAKNNGRNRVEVL